jgi:hypothetical protein
MILSLFLIFFAFAIIMLCLGQVMLMDALRILGATILIILGSVFLFSGIDVPSSVELVTSGSVTTVTQLYTSYTNHMLAFFFQMFGLVLFIFILVDRKFMSNQ